MEFVKKLFCKTCRIQSLSYNLCIGIHRRNKMKIVYVHGLGGSGTGSSSKNIQKLLDGIYKDSMQKYDFYAGTYDLLQPMESFNQIQKDVEDADFIIASSLGGFYSSALDMKKVKGKVILLNPCLKPQEAIEPLLYEEQKALFNKEKCLKEWDEIQTHWKERSNSENDKYAGIFADGDEYFHYKNVFDENFKPTFGENSALIEGVHEIAKHPEQLEAAMDAAMEIFRAHNEELQKYVKETLPKIFRDDD